MGAERKTCALFNHFTLLKYDKTVCFDVIYSDTSFAYVCKNSFDRINN